MLGSNGRGESGETRDSLNIWLSKTQDLCKATPCKAARRASQSAVRPKPPLNRLQQAQAALNRLQSNPSRGRLVSAAAAHGRPMRHYPNRRGHCPSTRALDAPFFPIRLNVHRFAGGATCSLTSDNDRTWYLPLVAPPSSLSKRPPRLLCLAATNLS